MFCDSKYVPRAATTGGANEVRRTELTFAMERREKEEEIWLSRTNSRLGMKPDSGGETVDSTEVFACSIVASETECDECDDSEGGGTRARGRLTGGAALYTSVDGLPGRPLTAPSGYL